MPLQTAIAVENNFRNGLITEATGLNFPENACTAASNVTFAFDGSVRRRLGINYESNFAQKTIDRTLAAVSTYLWKDVGGDGNTSLIVSQVGSTLYFYEVGSAGVSNGAVASTVTLTPVSGAPATNTLECQYSSGNGLLFVTHSYCEPMYISYDTTSQTATATNIILKIRDFEGDTADANAVTDRPTATLAGLEVHHKYNLYNQGWTTTNLTAWDTAFTTMPSNADVMYLFKNSSGDFTASTTVVAQVDTGMVGNTPAAKGHFILTLSSGDRDGASGFSGSTATSASYWRPSTSTFYDGRVFYAGLNQNKFNTRIYFSRIVENAGQYGNCYQDNDPTSENFFDLLPSDGGVISIPDAGAIIKLFPHTAGLVVIANRGVWLITGNQGIGFTADDYTQIKLSNINTLSNTSCVDVAGNLSWWTVEGIYMLTVGQSGGPVIQSITYSKIKTFFDAIPAASKGYARGMYDHISGVIQWVYKSTEGSTPTDIYTFDSILNFNTFTGAWYTWTIDTSLASINSILLLQTSAGSLAQVSVVDDTPHDVIDDSSNSVVSYIEANSTVVPGFIYFCSQTNGSSYSFTFGSERDLAYVDWESADTVGADYTSTFTSGYKLRGKAINKWQPIYLRLYSNNTGDTAYSFSGLWDYAVNAAANRWSNAQTITHSNSNYGTLSARIKVRGHGQALQFKVSSTSGDNFYLIGWSEYSAGNSVP